MNIPKVILIFLLVAVASGWAQTPSGYEYGLFLLDRHEWDQAVHEFDRVVVQKGTQADAAMYWEAYALSKAERPVEALSALAVLRKAFPMSRWLQDAAALEMDLKRAAGEHLTPESQSDEELKLLALNSVMRSDPERAIPAVESLLKQSQSPTLKREALYVLAQNHSAKAQELMEQIARGSLNMDLKAPGLQALAVRYLVQQKRTQGDLAPLLRDIYNSTAEADVKREAVNGLKAIGETDLLFVLPRDGSPAMLALKGLLSLNGQRAVGPGSIGQVVADYQAQKDRTVKQGIIDGQQKNAAALIAIARVENDPYFKKRIVEHLIDLNTPESKEYLLELLK